MYPSYMYPWSLILIHAYMYDAFIHVACFYDACIHDAYIRDAYIYVPRSLTLMHVCMMSLYDIYDSWIYDAMFFGNGRTDERTDGQGDSRSLKIEQVFYKYWTNIQQMCQSGVFNGQLLHEVWQWLLQSGKIYVYVLTWNDLITAVITAVLLITNVCHKLTDYLQEEETFWNKTCLAKGKFCSQFGCILIQPPKKFHAGIALCVFFYLVIFENGRASWVEMVDIYSSQP